MSQSARRVDLPPGRVTVTHLTRPMGGLIASYRVSIDGRRAGRLGRGKTRTFELPPGVHVLKLKILYCDSGDFPVRVAPGEEVKLTCRARPYSRASVLTERHNWILIDVVERMRSSDGSGTTGRRHRGDAVAEGPDGA